MLVSIKTACLAGIFLLYACAAFSATNIEFLFDCSASMKDSLGIQTKMDAAKASFQGALDDWTFEAAGALNIGLRLYGHVYDSVLNDEENCSAAELVVPIAGFNKSELSEKVALAQGRGLAPLAYALGQAAKDFMGKEGDDNFIILISDGRETCKGDPVQGAAQLIRSAAQVFTNVIGFDVNEEEAEQLKAIARAGGGEYLSAQDQAQLKQSIQEAVATVEKVVIEKAAKSFPVPADQAEASAAPEEQTEPQPQALVQEEKAVELPPLQGKFTRPGSDIKTAPLIAPFFKKGTYKADIVPGEKLFYRFHGGKDQTFRFIIRMQRSGSDNNCTNLKLSWYDKDYSEISNPSFMSFSAGKGICVQNYSFTDTEDTGREIYMVFEAEDCRRNKTKIDFSFELQIETPRR